MPEVLNHPLSERSPLHPLSLVVVSRGPPVSLVTNTHENHRGLPALHRRIYCLVFCVRGACVCVCVCVFGFTIFVGTRSPHKDSKTRKGGDILPVPTRKNAILGLHADHTAHVT